MDREQFISHVEGTQNAFRRFLVALCCGDAQLADDIAQEAYIKAYLSCDSFNSPDKFNAWIYRIGYNTFLNHKRSEHMFASYDEARHIQAAGTAPDGAFRYQGLYQALDMLPDKERTSVLLFYMEGYSIKEIAGIVDASPDAVKQHLSRGRNHLRGLLSTK
ncbi:MAG: RNA polymerase sigma factor [Muribaculaceae bacterium]|nr:RNA polymerase sigma factor [Muribaculaceae bacterium]